MIRLDKYLADMGIGTRSQVKKEISKGTVKVNHTVIQKPETKIDIQKDHVTYLEEPVGYQDYEYYMLNKPAGVVSATEDKRDQTVLDLITGKKRKDLFPVGRLDKDTEGLLLITNDGALAHRLLAPAKHVDKVYYAVIEGVVTSADVQLFRSGIDIGEKDLTRSAALMILSVDELQNRSEIHLTIHEGKFHQVKRMFAAVDKEVIYLKRISMGSLILDQTLAPGAYRPLTDKELEELC